MRFLNLNAHKGHIHYLQTLKGVVTMLRDPHHTESVFDIEDGLRDVEAYRLATEHLRTLPGVATLMDERYLAPATDVPALEKLPEGTLGREYARHIREHGFDADYFRKREIETDVDWVMMRMRQCHDIWHVITGLGVGSYGELGLKAFELAQTRRPMAAVITTGGIMRYVMKTPEEFPAVMNYISHGYRLGSVAKPFLAAKWEDGWDRPVSEWRDQLDAHPEKIEPYELPFDPTREKFEPAGSSESVGS